MNKEAITSDGGFFQKIKIGLSKPIDGSILGLFRIIFGVFMSYEMIRYFQMDLIKNAFILPQVKLQYFDCIRVMPEPIMRILLALLFIAALLITLGLFFRVACLFFGTGYLYVFLLDKGIYNNHIYLFILLSFLLASTHADDFISFKRAKKGSAVATKIPYWELFIFQLQFAIVYFYGGLAKINPEWLVRMEPITSMVNSFPPNHTLAFFYKHSSQIPLLTYGGMLFDLIIPFMLWFKKTRKIALFPLIFFHLSNSIVFDDIGIFPFVMIFSTLLYFDKSEIPFLRNVLSTSAAKAKQPEMALHKNSFTRYFLIGFFVFQFLFPFRGFFLPHHLDWTSIGNRFAWRMKIQTRVQNKIAFTIQDGPASEPLKVEMNTFVNPMQILSISSDPRAVLSMAKILAQEGKKRKMKDPIVKAEVFVGWNGRPPAYLVNPETDLSKVSYSSFKINDWIMPKPE